jgi:hypothetical protein
VWGSRCQGAFTSAMGGGKLGSARSSSAVRHVHIGARRDLLLARQLSYRKLTSRGGGMTTFSLNPLVFTIIMSSFFFLFP